jgi:hypothetical protein
MKRFQLGMGRVIWYALVATNKGNQERSAKEQGENPREAA